MKITMLLLPALFMKVLSFSPVIYKDADVSTSSTITCYKDKYRVSIDHFDYTYVIAKTKSLKKSTIQQNPNYHIQCGLQVSIDSFAEEFIFNYNFYADIECKNPVANNVLCEDSMRCSTLAIRCCQKNNTIPCNKYLFYPANIHGQHDIADLCGVRDNKKCYFITFPNELPRKSSNNFLASNIMVSTLAPILFTNIILYTL